MIEIINSFSEEFSFLSNFAPVNVVLDGVTYRSVEHAYVAAKTLDPEIRKQVRLINSPGAAKRFGRKFDLRPDWEEIKLDVMENLLRQKFSQEPFKSNLELTKGFELIEGNWWGDTFWGVCRGVGENHLGKLLMEIRDQ